MLMALTENTRLEFPPHVVTRVVEDSLAVLDANSGTYFSVNEVGVTFVERARDGASLGEIAERVASEYEVSREEALADLIELAQSFLNEGLADVRETQA